MLLPKLQIMKRYLLIFLLVNFTGCGLKEDKAPVTMMRVNSYTVDCVGEMEGKCLLVQEGEAIGSDDWHYFYYEDSIIGFDYEPGYIYLLAVKRTPVKNPPADASSYEYELVRVISRKEQA